MRPQRLVVFATPSLRTSPSARADKATIDADGYFWFVGRDARRRTHEHRGVVGRIDV